MYRSSWDNKRFSNTLPSSMNQQQSSSSGFAFERSIPGRYEKNLNGEMEYIMIVDVNEFKPHEVKIEQKGNMIVVEAKKTFSTENNYPMHQSSQNESKEFRKEVSLPYNADINRNIRSNYNSNGLLEIFIPLIPQPSYASSCSIQSRPITVQKVAPQTVTFSTDLPNRKTVTNSVYTTRQAVPSSSDYWTTTSSNSNNNSNSNIFNNNNYSHLAISRPLSAVNRTVVSSSNGMYSEEIFFDFQFLPEDVTVRSKDGNKVIISAKHEDRGPNGYSNMKEFNDEHNLPDNVDGSALKATMTERGTLLLEAPYRTAYPAARIDVRTSIPVHRR